jgi:hypothetical protein
MADAGMMAWICCSAGRPEMLVKKTLATLERGNFRASLYVVVPSDEVLQYSQALKKSPVHCILLHCERGLVRQRQFIRNAMPPHAPLVFLDDDLEAIKILQPDGKLRHAEDIHLLAAHMIQMLFSSGNGRLIGVYPLCNRMWMTKTVVESNAYVAGAFYAIINDPEFKEGPGDEGEDYWRQLAQQAAGNRVLRLNYVGIQTQYFKNAGGLQAERSEAKREAAIAELVAAFPALVRKKIRKDGKPDLKFLGAPATYIIPTEALEEESPSDSSAPCSLTSLSTVGADLA